MSAGPWSLELINRHKSVVTGDAIPIESNGNKKYNSGAPRVTKKKDGGYLRNCAQNLKHIDEQNRKCTVLPK